MTTKMPDHGERALVYVRHASARVDQLTDFTAQGRECAELCRQQGWHVTAMLDDTGQSRLGSRTPPRLDSLAQALRDNRCFVLVVASLDRIARDAGAMIAFMRATQPSVQIVTVDQGPISSRSLMFSCFSHPYHRHIA